jgi:hypothetical protein
MMTNNYLIIVLSSLLTICLAGCSTLPKRTYQHRFQNINIVEAVLEPSLLCDPQNDPFGCKPRKVTNQALLNQLFRHAYFKSTWSDPSTTYAELPSRHRPGVELTHTKIQLSTDKGERILILIDDMGWKTFRVINNDWPIGYYSFEDERYIELFERLFGSMGEVPVYGKA